MLWKHRRDYRTYSADAKINIYCVKRYGKYMPVCWEMRQFI